MEIMANKYKLIDMQHDQVLKMQNSEKRMLVNKKESQYAKKKQCVEDAFIKTLLKCCQFKQVVFICQKMSTFVRNPL